jgi:hypothetical protein
MSIDERQIGQGRIIVYVPHYWARYVHDGTGRVRGVMMVWFPNPKNDPRLANGRPVTRSQIKRLRLSRKKFYALKRQGILVVSTSRKAIKAHPFFKRAIRRLQPWLHTQGRRKFLGEIREEFKETFRKYASKSIVVEIL